MLFRRIKIFKQSLCVFYAKYIYKKKLINCPDNLIYNTAVDALENLKRKKETKPIEDKSDNKLKATTIFNKLINERKKNNE